jgi:uncharacterized membrane protein YbaN (DUF454 family)
MSRGGKPVYVILGSVFLAAAVVGVFLPIVPQVPFAVIAAFFFSKGSPRLHHWMLNNKHFGAPIRDWENGQVVRPRLKAFSVCAMIVGAGLAYYRYHADTPSVAYGIAGAFALASIFVLTRPSEMRAPPPSKYAGVHVGT